MVIESTQKLKVGVQGQEISKKWGHILYRQSREFPIGWVGLRVILSLNG